MPEKLAPHFDSAWWARQNYHDPLSRSVKVKRLLWLIAWHSLAGWMPYFVGRKWRVFLLRCFGMKDNGHVGFYPSAKVWAPWNLELGSYVAIDDQVNLYSAAKMTIGTKVAISREAFICTASDLNAVYAAITLSSAYANATSMRSLSSALISSIVTAV